MATSRTIIFHLAGHVAGIAAYGLTSLLGGAVYIIAMSHAFGPQDGLAIMLYMLIIPVFVGAVGAIAWLPLWFIIWFFAGFVRWYHIVVPAAIIAALASILYCGGVERCFAPGGHARMLGAFATAIMASCALAHHLVVQWVVKRTSRPDHS